MRSPRPFAGLLCAVGIALFTSQCTGGFREDEIECEQAMHRLEECCPGFQADQASCTYAQNVDSTDVPAFSINESHCIQDQDCNQLLASGVCMRAQHLPYVPESSSTPQPVCP